MNSEALFGSHALKSGETQYNNFGLGDTERELGPTALTDAISKMNRFKNHNGIQLLPVRQLKMIVSTEKSAYAYKLLDSRQGPDVANLGLQVASAEALKRRGIDISITVAPDIPYAYREYWSLSEVGRAQRRAFMAYAWKPRMNETPEYNNGTMIKTGSTIFGPVVLGWQWAFGSKGSNAAIS